MLRGEDGQHRGEGLALLSKVVTAGQCGVLVNGKDVETARSLLADARALEAAGVFAIVLEGVPDTLAAAITAAVAVPTIGIGAGPGTDGQVLVFHDVLGYHDQRLPKFVRPYAHLFDEAVAGLTAFFADVESGAFPTADESYTMPEEAARALLEEGEASAG